MKLDDNIKHYDDLLTVEEQELLISHINDKILRLECDIKKLREERAKYKDIFYRFIDSETVCRFLIKVQKDYRAKIIKVNKDKDKLICGNYLDLKERMKPINVDFVLKSPYESKWTEKEEEEKKKVIDVVSGYKNELLDSILFDLDYSKGSEASDIRYYKKVINKIKNDGKVSYNDAQELWIMCDLIEKGGYHDINHSDLHPNIITKLKEYCKSFGDVDVKEDD